MAKYDEDIHGNPYFCTFRDKFTSRFDLVAEKCWMTCIPRTDAAVHMKINQADIENHILIREEPNKDDENATFVTMNGKYVTINGDIMLTGTGFKEEKQVKILFSEDFFNSNDQSYQVLCVDQPLEGGCDDSSFSLAISMETVEDCSSFLWNEPAGERVKKTVDSMCNTVYISPNKIHPQAIKEIALAVYTKALEEAGSKLTHWKRVSSLSARSFFQLAIESYVLDKLHPMVFKSLCRVDLGDKAMNEMTRQFTDVSSRDLGISDNFKDNLTSASRFLTLLNTAKCPLEKLNCLKKTMSSLAKGSANSTQTNVVSADEFLPMLVCLVLKAEIPNWKCNLHYIKEFQFSQVNNEELLYYLTSFEAATEYITSGDLQKNLGKDFRKPTLPNTVGMNETERANAEFLNNLLTTVHSGGLESCKKIVRKMNQVPDDICQQLCHPLCDCKKCLPIVRNFNEYSSRISIFSKDSFLRNSLHYATLSGQCHILEWLLDNSELKDDVNEEDINQQTLLHLAALVGNQKCLLYLLYKGAAVNKVDRHGNTPLHLACSHGYEECVKGLIFHTSTKCNLSCRNNHGDSPLHLAARWGFASIVSLLLEHGADPKLKNTIGETAVMATFDYKVFSTLRPPSLDDTEVPLRRVGVARHESSSAPSSSVRVRQHRSSIAVDQLEGVGGATGSRIRYKRRSGVVDLKSETEKQIKKLFRAINDNDFGMVNYFFGWKNSQDGGVNQKADFTDGPPLSPSPSDLCHPLCQCEKCLPLRKGRPLPLVTVNSRDSKGSTPLHKAALHGHRQIVQALLLHGAGMNVRNKDEMLTPLHLACQYNQRDIVMILLENGVQVNPCDKRGNTPLHFCCNNGHMDSAKLLMIHGADLTIPNDRGDTPLHNAARWNHSSLVRELLLYGAMYSVTNKDNKTPLDLTTDDEVYEIIQQAMKGEIPTGEYACSKHAEDPGISDDEFEHV